MRIEAGFGSVVHIGGGPRRPAAVGHAARTRAERDRRFRSAARPAGRPGAGLDPRPAADGTGYSWFPLDASLTLNQLEESTDAVLDWLDRLPPAPSIGLLGFSQGAATAFQVLRRRPDAFAYAVNLAGFVVPFPAAGDAAVAGRRPPTFWGRGERDRVIPSPLVTSTRDWLRRHTELTEKIYPNLGHNVSESELADLSAFLAAQIHP